MLTSAIETGMGSFDDNGTDYEVVFEVSLNSMSYNDLTVERVRSFVSSYAE